MNNKEFDFLKMVLKAEMERNRITFNNNTDEIEKFQKKYGDVFNLLLDKGYVNGGITTYNELSITRKGGLAMIDFDIEARKVEYETRRFKRDVIIAIISSLVSVLASWLLMKL